MEFHTDLDIEYARSVCFSLDVRILMLTAIALLRKRGE
jgi:lipopolysaccharide/colanic/teichoic acid biosynthesis glycosyltransferase